MENEQSFLVRRCVRRFEAGKITEREAVQRIHWRPLALDGADLAYATPVGADLKGAIQRNADVGHTIHAPTPFGGPIL